MICSQLLLKHTREKGFFFWSSFSVVSHFFHKHISRAFAFRPTDRPVLWWDSQHWPSQVSEFRRTFGGCQGHLHEDPAVPWPPSGQLSQSLPRLVAGVGVPAPETVRAVHSSSQAEGGPATETREMWTGIQRNGNASERVKKELFTCY